MISDQNNHVFMAVFFINDQWSFIIIFIPAWKQREEPDFDPADIAEDAFDEGEDYVAHKKHWR